MRVRSWMTSPAETVRPDDTLETARGRMVEGAFRSLPVLDDGGNLIGVLTDRDLRQHLGYLSSTRVTAAMVEKPITVHPDTPIETAAALVLERKVGGLPVVDESGSLLGIVTATDLLRGLLRMVRGGEHESVRIDIEFSSSEQTFAEAVRLAESAGGTILGLGTLREDDQAERRTFYIRLLARDLEKLTRALREGGYVVKEMHGSRVGPQA
jgi:acetoin utilization protein AcuB